MGETRDPTTIGWSVFVGDKSVASVGVKDKVVEPITLRVFRHLPNGAMQTTDVEIPAPGQDPKITHEYYHPGTEEHNVRVATEYEFVDATPEED